jgi:hypothetical protein
VERLHQAARALGSTQPYAPYLAEWKGPWNFAGYEETAARLERAGFTEVDTWLEPAPVTPADPISYMRTVCLGPHLERLPEKLRDGYVAAMLDRCGPELGYVRLNMDASSGAP